MNVILTEMNSWVTAAILAVLMLAGWAAGWCRARTLSQEEREASSSKFTDAVLALLGLLLAFTFSM